MPLLSVIDNTYGRVDLSFNLVAVIGFENMVDRTLQYTANLDRKATQRPITCKQCSQLLF